MTKYLHALLRWVCKVFGIRLPLSSVVGGVSNPDFDQLPLQPHRGGISVERSELPSANLVGVTSTTLTKYLHTRYDNSF